MIFLWNSWSFDSKINLNVFYSIRAAAYNWPFERSLDFDPNFLQAKCVGGNNIQAKMKKFWIFFCCTQISMWLYILRHMAKKPFNLSQYISPNRYLKISKSPYNRKKNFSRNIVMWVLYQDARRSLIQCKRNQRNPTLWCWENVQNVSENEAFWNNSFSDTFWTFSQHQKVGLRWFLLHWIRLLLASW